jgi:hypothetical protein
MPIQLYSDGSFASSRQGVQRPFGRSEANRIDVFEANVIEGVPETSPTINLVQGAWLAWAMSPASLAD